MLEPVAASPVPDSLPKPLLLPDTTTRPEIVSTVANHSLAARRVLVGTDALLMLLTGLAVSQILAFTQAGQASPAFSLVAVPALLLPLFWLDLYPGFGLMRPERLRRRWLAGLIWTVLLIPVALLSGTSPALPALTVMLFTALAPFGEELARSLLIARQRWGKPALVRGPERLIESSIRILAQNPHLGLIPVRQAEDTITGTVDTEILTPGTVICEQHSQMQSLYVIEEGGILHTLQQPEHWLAALVERMSPSNPRREPWLSIKRGIDIVIGSAALVLSLPIVLASALAIYATDPGPTLYRQYRRGLNGKAVYIWKLRSMYQDSEQRLERLLAEDLDVATEWQAHHKLRNDPRILPGIGYFIRKFSIDELPQLINVLKGELSLVGPRVFVDYDLDIYSPEALRLRHSVLPGLTGLWQVSVRNDGDNADKVRYDSAYVRSWSLWSDLDILYRTFGVVLTGRGAA